MPLGSYIVNPGNRSRNALSGGVLAFDRPEVQVMAVCDCRLRWQRVYAPVPRRWKQEWLTEACMNLQQRLEGLGQLQEAHCSAQMLFDEGDKLAQGAGGAVEHSAALALFSGIRADRVTVTPLVTEQGSVCLLTPGGGLSVLAQKHFALQTVASSPCIVMILDKTLERRQTKRLLQAEQGLLAALEKAETPEEVRKSWSAWGLRTAAFWGWEEFREVKEDFRQRHDRITTLLQQLDQLPQGMAEKILLRFSAGE